MYIVAGTGSRSFKDETLLESPFDEPWARIGRSLYDYIEEDLCVAHADLVLGSGGAEGWDYQIALAAKFFSLPLKLYLPNRTYGDYYWRRTSVTGRDRSGEFQAMVDYASSTAGVVYVCAGIYKNNVHANFWRNSAMVDEAQEFVVYNPSSPGTKDCFTKILKKGIPYRVFA